MLAFLAGTLPGPDGILVRSHLNSCLKCQDSIAELASQYGLRTPPEGDDDLTIHGGAGHPSAAQAEPPRKQASRKPSLADESAPEDPSFAVGNETAESAKGQTKTSNEPVRLRKKSSWDLGFSSNETIDLRQLPPPRRLGKYEVIRLVGRGGFADVYLARHPQLDERVAIKVPHARAATSPEVVDAFLKEARTAANLRHPNIVSIRDVEVADSGQPYVVMDWMDGGTLDEVRKSRELPLTEVVSIMTDLARAMAHAHKHGFIHRDLKPGNILFDQFKRAHIADFGLAVHERELQDRTGELAGTRRFMSPEQMRRDAQQLDARTDVWALGVIFYLLLTSESPFDGDRAEIKQQILTSDPPPPRKHNPNLPPEIAALCLECLKKPREERIASAEELANRLEAFTATQLRKQTRRRMLIGAGSLLAVASVAAYGGYWLYDRNRRIQVEEIFRIGDVDWSYDWDGNVAFDAFAGVGNLMLSLGRVPPDTDCRIGIEMEQAQWTGGADLFLGLREAGFHSFQLGDLDAGSFLERRREEFDPRAPRKTFVGPTKSISNFVAPPGQARRTRTVEFDIVSNSIDRVAVDGVPCAGVEDAGCQAELIDHGGYSGRFGILATFASGRIVSVKCETLV